MASLPLSVHTGGPFPLTGYLRSIVVGVARARSPLIFDCPFSLTLCANLTPKRAVRAHATQVALRDPAALEETKESSRSCRFSPRAS